MCCDGCVMAEGLKTFQVQFIVSCDTHNERRSPCRLVAERACSELGTVWPIPVLLLDQICVDVLHLCDVRCSVCGEAPFIAEDVPMLFCGSLYSDGFPHPSHVSVYVVGIVCDNGQCMPHLQTWLDRRKTRGFPRRAYDEDPVCRAVLAER